MGQREVMKNTSPERRMGGLFRLAEERKVDKLGRPLLRTTLSNLAREIGDHCQPYGRGDTHGGAVQVLYRSMRANWRYYRLAGWVVTAHCSGPSIVLCRRVSR